MIDDLDEDDCEDMEIIHMSHEELVAAQNELNRLRRIALNALASKEVDAR